MDTSKGHFTHETESPWPVPFKHSRLVGKAEPVQVCCFPLRLGDQRSIWMQDGCEVDVDSYMASNGSCFMVAWPIFQNHLLEVGLTQKLGDHGTLNDHNHWFSLFYHMWGPARIHWNSIWLRAWSPYDFTLHLRICDHTTWFWRCLGTAFRHFLLGSHYLMVTALGLCVKWP